MSDQHVVHDQVTKMETAEMKWVPIASAEELDEARRFGVLLENADIPHAIGERAVVPEGTAKPVNTVTVCVQEAHYERACEIIAIDHAELSDVLGDDDDDDYYDDDHDDPDEDLDDDDDDVFLDDDDDDLDDDLDDDDDDYEDDD